MRIDTFFTKQEKEAIEKAVALEESRSAAEIVPFVVEASAPYEETAYRAGIVSYLVFLTVGVVVFHRSGVWYPISDIQFAAGSLVLAAALGWFAHAVAPIRRLLLGRRHMDECVARRARDAFVTEQVYRTQDGTGILIFISLFERRIHVLADHGFSGIVTQEEWDKLVADLSLGIQSDRPASSIIQAIQRCGALARRRGPARRIDDRDELGDSLRVQST